MWTDGRAIGFLRGTEGVNPRYSPVEVGPKHLVADHAKQNHPLTTQRAAEWDLELETQRKEASHKTRWNGMVLKADCRVGDMVCVSEWRNFRDDTSFQALLRRRCTSV